MVAELASRRVKMVLTGEGGDELFAGYARYAGERLAPAFGRLRARAAQARHRPEPPGDVQRPSAHRPRTRSASPTSGAASRRGLRS